MSKFTSNSTLYDLLSAIIPGYLVLLWLQLSFPSIIPLGVFNADSNLTNAIIVFALSYIVGLVFKIIIEVGSNPIFRNRTTIIFSTLRVAEVPGTFVKSINDLVEENSKIDERNKRGDYAKIVYYKEYYKALKARVNTPIPIMESQVAFLRSMIGICLIFILSSSWISEAAGISTFCLTTVLILLEFLMLMLIFHIQKSIYRIVWEDAYYYELEFGNTQKLDKKGETK